MLDRHKRPLLAQLAEALFAIALVLVFFCVIMLVLNLLFPQGGLQLFAPADSGHESDPQHLRRPAQSVELALSGTDATLQSRDWAATLVDLHNLVKSKRAIDIAWQPAEVQMPLYSLDAVQTLEDSSARIRFDARNEIDLGANSLIVIRRMEQDPLFHEKRSFMVVVDGELRGRIGGSGDDNVYLEIATPNAVARLQSSAASTTPIEFSIHVAEGDLSTVALFSGSAEIEAQGATVRLQANQLTHIDGATAPSVPVALPALARLSTPATDAVFAYRDLPPRLSFAWQPPQGAERFRLQLARDAGFRDLLVDEALTAPRFVHGNLAPGRYFWRVSCLQAGDEGAFTPPRGFRLIEDREPPLLQIEPLADPITTATIELRGRSESDATVYIGGNAVPLAADGSFRQHLTLEPGMNIIVVEATDAAGNVSYSSHQLYALLENRR